MASTITTSKRANNRTKRFGPLDYKFRRILRDEHISKAIMPDGYDHAGKVLDQIPLSYLQSLYVGANLTPELRTEIGRVLGK